MKRRAALALLALLPLEAAAIAFCALRDPTQQIYELYPQATAFRSLVEHVDTDVKKVVAAELPFTLHNRELGKHTLYVALSDGEPLGLVHVRAEASRWGLIEIAWALSFDLTIRDYRFQRCRDRACRSLAADPFRSWIVGQSASTLSRTVTGNGAHVDIAQLPAGKGEGELAAALVRSALKTILVTEAIWSSDIANLLVRSEPGR